MVNNVNAQDYIDKYYSKNARSLEIKDKGLKGELNLTDFANLEELYCSKNELSSLKLSNCPELKTVHCDTNKLVKIIIDRCPKISCFKVDNNLLDEYSIFDSLPTILTYLDIRDNSFEPDNLVFLSGFSELETLKLGRKRNNYLDNYKGSKTNAFGGSLEPLQNMNKLKELSIINTDINGGLKYLPTSLEKIRCGASTFSNYNCREICEQLKDYKLEENYYDLRSWRGNQSQEGIITAPQIAPAEESDVRNILIVGLTGSGKSTLANVLTSTNDFKEGDSSISVTENFQKSGIFEWKGKKYRVIDNVGFGDNSDLTLPDLLYTIGQAIRSAKGKINQVLFVFKDRFTDEQAKAFNLFKNFISQSRIVEFTTIVRTNFLKFDSDKECKEDQKNLLSSFDKSRDSERKEFVKMIKNCKFVHVNNPPLPMASSEVDDDISKKEREVEIGSSKRKRGRSREKLLNHLAENCCNIYKLEGWDSIYSRVIAHMKKRGEIEKELSDSKSEGNLTKEKQIQAKLEDSEKKFADEMSFRLGISPLTLETFIEVGLKNPQCCLIS